MTFNLHTALMKRAILSNCKGEYFVVPSEDNINKARMVNKEEFAKIMLGYAAYIAENCPQLFTAIPLYFTYSTEAISDKVVTEFVGQSLPVTTSVPTNGGDVYSRQTIAINEEMRLELCYSFSKPVVGEVYYKNQLQAKFDIKSLNELCDIIQRYSGEIVTIED